MNRGLIILFAAWLFAVIETVYFGSNWYPESFAEWICDAIGAIGVLIGGFIFLKALTKKLR